MKNGAIEQFEKRTRIHRWSITIEVVCDLADASDVTDRFNHLVEETSNVAPTVVRSFQLETSDEE